MLLAAASVLYLVLTFPFPTPSSTAFKLLLSSTLTLILSLVVYAHISSGDSTLHQIAFVVMIWVVGYCTLALMNRTVENAGSRRGMRRMAVGGTGKGCFFWFAWR